MPPIYVEIEMRCPMDQLWARTQSPVFHRRWDLRFSDIEYLPHRDSSQPQRFLYATRIGFGLRIAGEGESLGSEQNDGSRTSALKFWSEDPKSLILKGSGYWRYIPTAAGVRFLTWYDYSTRFGFIGRTFDAVVFRPLIGWATAWSFDRLRLWIEKEIDPAVSLRQSVVYGISRATVAFIWIYQGLVPKLLTANSDETMMLRSAGIAGEHAGAVIKAIGLAEMAFGIALLTTRRARPMFAVTILVMIIALISVALRSPAYLAGAFNPVTLNVAMIALSVIGMFSEGDLPSAGRCRRTQTVRTQ
jgi:DoxX-like family